MWEPENIMVVSQEWYTHYGERDRDDDTTYCDVYECSECPRCGDDCDGKEEEDDE